MPDTLKRTQRPFGQSGEKWLKILPLIIPKWADTVKKNYIRVARMVGNEPKKWPITEKKMAKAEVVV